MDVRQFLALRRVTAVAPSPDGTWLAASVQVAHPEGGRWRAHLWRVPLAPGEASRQLTTGDHQDTAPRFDPRGALCFLSDRGSPESGPGAGRRQVWALSGNEVTQRTDEPLGVLDARFGPSGMSVVLAPRLPGIPERAQRQVADERARNGPSALHYDAQPVRRWDRWLGPEVPQLVRTAPGPARNLTPESGRALDDLAWELSPDGKTIALAPAHLGPDDVHDKPLTLLDVRTGATRTLETTTRTTHAAPRWSPDGAFVATLRHQRIEGGHGRPMLCVTEVRTGRMRTLAEAWDRWPTPAAWTPDGRGVVVTAPDRGRVALFVVDVATGAVHPLWDGDGSHEQVQLAGEHIVGLRHGLLQPPEPFASPLVGGAPRLLATLSGVSRAHLETLAKVTWSEVESADGQLVHHALVSPGAAAGQGPAVLWVHGGPISHWADAWNWRWNPLPFVHAGLTVALPNPRGSVGYGQVWVDGIWENAWGGACADDVMASADALARAPGVDPSRMALMGGSFGGWMVNWLCTRTERFRCAVTHAAIFDHGRMYGDCDSPGEWAWHLDSTPDSAPEAHARYSPQRGVAGWRTPTLIVHGEKDYCVPISQGLALFQALQRRSIPSELLVFPDEGHWILRPTNIAAWHDAILAYLAAGLAPRKGRVHTG